MVLLFLTTRLPILADLYHQGFVGVLEYVLDKNFVPEFPSPENLEGENLEDEELTQDGTTNTSDETSPEVFVVLSLYLLDFSCPALPFPSLPFPSLLFPFLPSLPCSSQLRPFLLLFFSFTPQALNEDLLGEEGKDQIATKSPMAHSSQTRRNRKS